MSWLPVVALVSGLIAGFVPGQLVERRKERHILRTRWDASLSIDFVSACQRYQRLVGRLGSAVDGDAHRVTIETEREAMGALLVQLRLVGNVRVQRAARMMIRHAWAVLRVAEGHEDPRAAEFGGAPPGERMREAEQEFIRACRVQLRVAEAEDLAADEPSQWPVAEAPGRPWLPAGWR
ncbi:hypothetical protein DFJ67_7761 [Asanoa ferruginea]|uniref:Uncharacterized protein n=1 Tax=Asanoa ferruginea TaxID=53367 RepID=A0A3D9ZWY3_9ACTN|nr:hypothetical protein [Asanoa ferruginea]REG01676.1 hypothetical protein DFJ67_7761 [Asanoa ferruginea]GIF51686.1 hypothetical protein Afe04nite_62250 [Asanoa ferruginea]